MQIAEIKTDNLSLVEAVHSTAAVEEKRLRVEMASIRESIRKNEIKVEWVNKEEQLADVLTKQGADSTKLMAVLHTGKIQTQSLDRNIVHSVNTTLPQNIISV